MAERPNIILRTRLRQVLPSATEYYVSNCALADIILFAQKALRYPAVCISASYGKDLISGQFRPSDLLTPNDSVRVKMGSVLVSRCCPAFLQHIKSIICNRPKEKVAGVDATRVVAGMADKKAIGDCAIMQFPRQAAGDPVAIAAPTSSHSAVSLCVFGSCPKPAVISLLHLAPKPVNKRCLWLKRNQWIAMIFESTIMSLAELESPAHNWPRTAFNTARRLWRSKIVPCAEALSRIGCFSATTFTKVYGRIRPHRKPPMFLVPCLGLFQQRRGSLLTRLYHTSWQFSTGGVE